MSWLIKHSSSCSSQQTLSGPCVGLSVQIQGPTLSQPTLCGMGMLDPWLSTACFQLDPTQTPIQYPTTFLSTWRFCGETLTAVSSCQPDLQLNDRTRAVRHCQAAGQSMSTVSRGQRPETARLRTTSTDEAFCTNLWQFWKEAKP